ncbi:MAG: LysR family transcriptional regulator [Bacillota bacterium]
MDTRLLKTFLLVAQLQNITQAAEKLNFSQPTITAQIQNLEEIFGVLLFERQGKKLIITEAGNELYKYAEHMLAIYNEAQMALASYRKKSAALTLGVSTHIINYLLPPILKKYQSRVPDGSVCVRLFMSTKETLNGLLENQFYIGLVHDKISHEQFEQFKITTEEVIWAGHHDLLAKHKFSNCISDYPFINYTTDTVFRSKFNNLFKEVGCNSTIEYSDTQAVKQAVLNGLGISILPFSLIKEEIADGTLVQITNTPPLFLDIYVLFKRNAVFSPSIYKFLEILSELPTADSKLKAFIDSKKFKKSN